MSDPSKRRRRSIRLQGYDYSRSGLYFVTICTKGRVTFFEDARVKTIAETCWQEIADHFTGVTPDESVVMPNHVHGIVSLHGRDTACRVPTGRIGTFGPLPPGSLPAIVGAFKSASTRLIRQLGIEGFAWQPRYYEHVVRNDASLSRIRQYLRDNPARWAFDRDNPDGRPDATENGFWRGLG